MPVSEFSKNDPLKCPTIDFFGPGKGKVSPFLTLADFGYPFRFVFNYSLSRKEKEFPLGSCSKRERKANLNFCVKVKIRRFVTINNHIRDLYVF